MPGKLDLLLGTLRKVVIVLLDVCLDIEVIVAHLCRLLTRELDETLGVAKQRTVVTVARKRVEHVEDLGVSSRTPEMALSTSTSQRLRRVSSTADSLLATEYAGDIVRRLLERLEERVCRRPRQAMGILDDVDLACGADGSELSITRELANLLDKVTVGATRRVDVQVGVDTAQNLVLRLCVTPRDETGRKTQRQIAPRLSSPPAMR